MKSQSTLHRGTLSQPTKVVNENGQISIHMKFYNSIFACKVLFILCASSTIYKIYESQNQSTEDTHTKYLCDKDC